ncbi:energy-coupling factor transporter ATPase [Lactobacillus sp. PV037]|uniref:energy-coupling factor transporter ATPase n=1 Tax=Lactobacillus sp. PV037 TaxID=2594496 RepID=UPI00223ECC42|nr:energy-coupling factor transporter ATPase [Lactobacillus sp. PV037]QNQ84458.1 energy-coupling factor transporter ATPase [Lactobacillus sp. PV037]
MKDIIDVKHLSYTYADMQTPALSDISFSIQEKSWVSIVGHNGSGKSTLSKLLDGILEVDFKKNRILIDNILLDETTLPQIRDKIGIVFQNPDNQFVGATVQDDIAFGLENRDISYEKMHQIVPRVLEEVNMLKYKEKEPQNLSGGQKQRVAIAGILAIQPKIIILDEATSMLDPEGRKEILKVIKRLQKKFGLTVLSITHDIDEVMSSDEVLVLNEGNLMGKFLPDELFENEELVVKAGLVPPFLYQLRKEFEKKGIDIPRNLKTEKEVVEFLWQLNLKK